MFKRRQAVDNRPRAKVESQNVPVPEVKAASPIATSPPQKQKQKQQHRGGVLGSFMGVSPLRPEIERELV